ncbi:DNA cytosine methyltransferase [Brevundimonas diminuta]|uniref:DNA cytosine methyltransferase n=1 Tax=Brevundimonas diminuta TaxID=293 RepID=UPI0009DA3D6B|nr:DNA cytosine methyltransferase [Brevundimonas diminuta]OWR16568.1 DNA methyltransferase [Brevundimonas diminuta]WQE44823.1 DNA cytosine methyltransferase [Brevundimonas diminuta]
MKVLDLFSAAAGGWSLGLHRAGFETVAACEWIDWRRALYAENNPGVLIYDDVRTLTADRLRADLGALPDIIVGSPPCQDISSANTKGKGVDGERSGLFFEAIRIIGEVRPRWIALENSANLRTRGADAVLTALEDRDYACWATVVRAGDIGANHERPRSWIIGCDVEQLADAPEIGCAPWAGDHQGEHAWLNGRLAGHDNGDGNPLHASRLGREGRRSRRYGPNGDGATSVAGSAGSPAHTDQAGQADGPLVASLRQTEVADDGRGAGRRADGQGVRQVGLRPADRLAAFQHRADWSLDDLARHIRLDDGLPAWLAEQRIAVGGPRGTSAASLVVEAFGDAVIPQITEAIGRAILRVEAAMAAVARPERIAA